jgi:hypothetical protein
MLVKGVVQVYLFFNFVMLIMWQSSISIFSQIWQYSKYEKDLGNKVYIMLDVVNIAICPNCGMGGSKS